MALSQEKIEAVRQRCDIVDIIGRQVSLKKSGRNYVGLCPFHAEKSPSFSVSALKNLYHCFGCHVGGDVFDFVMRHEGLDFHTALRRLAAHAGVELEPESPQAEARRLHEQRVAAVNAATLAFFVATLWGPQGHAARRYLSERGIPAPFARARRLGFGGNGDALLAQLRQGGHGEAALEAAGICFEGGGRSLFSGRLVFPICDLQGRVAGFGGRRLGDAGGGPKYINSRDGVLFHKGSLLYGLYEAQPAIRRSRRVVVVEGYTDVLAAHRSGVGEAVAALGTAFSAEHAGTLRRLANEVLVLLDGDAAGMRAAYKVSMQTLRAGLKTAVVPLPAGEDPDSLTRRAGPRALQQHVAAARPAVAYFMDKAFRPGQAVEERADAARHLQPLLACLSGLERDLYMSRLAERVGLSLEQLRRHLRQAPAPLPPRPEARTTQRSAASPMPHAFELELLRELLLFPSLRARFGELAEYAVSAEMAHLLEYLASSDEPANSVVQTQLAHMPGWCARLSRVQPCTSNVLDDVPLRANRTFQDVLASLKRRHLDAALHELLNELRDTEARGDATDALLRRKRELTARKRALRNAGQSVGVSK